ncbi:hypothetical protein [Endozoicomonas sp. 8E]|uniref:hypothetical protein n=1 Tax=Endozoicomonas sp. 8E TaxID=3035692 RepID=UPI0029391092|nr:hypothetical protein [Endozoicomonas sp. 8E]WOG26855.1 hypothetical protein P6910_20245 [Endozoicomonas sp. 8E]
MISATFSPSTSAIKVYKKEGRILVLRDVPISQVFTPQVMMAAAVYNSPVALSGAILGSFFGGLGALLFQDADALNSLASSGISDIGSHAFDYTVSIAAASPEVLAVRDAVDSGIGIGCSLGTAFGASFGAFSIGFIFSNMIQRYGLDEAIRRFTHPWDRNNNDTEFE